MAWQRHAHDWQMQLGNLATTDCTARSVANLPILVHAYFLLQVLVLFQKRLLRVDNQRRYIGHGQPLLIATSDVITN